MTDSAAAIEMHDVAFTYDGDAFVLQGIDLRIARGEFVAVLGGNGSGKSTLAKHMNALLAPDAGRVVVLGRDASDPEAVYAIRSRAGMVFQNPDDQLVASLVENDVAFGPENLGIPAEELRERVDESLEAVGLAGFQKRETSALSGGQKQRVAVAGVLAMTAVACGQAAQTQTAETETAAEGTEAGYEDNFSVDSSAVIEFGEKVKAAVSEADLEGLAALASYPVYVGVDDGVVVNSAEELIALGAEKVITDELVEAVTGVEEAALTEPSEAGFVMTVEGKPNIIFGVVDGQLAITGINY